MARFGSNGFVHRPSWADGPKAAFAARRRTNCRWVAFIYWRESRAIMNYAQKAMIRPSLYLHTLDFAMAEAWLRAFTDVVGVHIVEGDILEGRCDAVVSPANSFGYMDGGIDLAYRNYFGMDLQSRVQATISSHFRGELPVGQATVVPTGNEVIPFLVVAPTMRIPDRIGDTVNVYLAFRAALLAVLDHNAGTLTAITSLRVPALGTGIGAMPLPRAARQMHAAHVAVFETPDWLKDPNAILVHHEHLRTG